MKINKVLEFLDEKYPKDLATEDDQKKIGLTIGNPNKELKRVLLSLDLTLEVVEEAIKNNINLIITHHPFLFFPIYKINYEDEKGQIIEKLIKNDIVTYSMHTNLDVGVDGVDDVLAELLDIKKVKGENIKESYLRYGDIDPIKLSDLCLFVKNKLNLTGVRACGDMNRIIRKIGVCGGSGGHISDINNAINANIDCYITGEVKMPEYQYANFNNLAIIEVNHGVEKFVFYKLKEMLLKTFDIEILISDIETDPMIIVK